MKITKRGKYISTVTVDFLCQKCLCQFKIEPGDRMRQIDHTNPVRNQRGTIIEYRRMQYDQAQCPDCDEYSSANFVQEVVPKPERETTR